MRRSARSINVCERTDGLWGLPPEVMCRVQRGKTWYSGQRGCILSPYQGQNGNPGPEHGSHREFLNALVPLILSRNAERFANTSWEQQDFHQSFGSRIQVLERLVGEQLVPAVTEAW